MLEYLQITSASAAVRVSTPMTVISAVQYSCKKTISNQHNLAKHGDGQYTAATHGAHRKKLKYS